MSTISATTRMNICGMASDSLRIIIKSLTAAMDDLGTFDQQVARDLIEVARVELETRGETGTP